MPSPNDIKKGTVLDCKNDLWVVVQFQRVSPGKGGSFVRTKMKSLSTGKVVEENLKASEVLTFADVSRKKMQYIFAEGSAFTFMDGVSYEQVSVAGDVVGDDAKYLKEGLDVTVVMHGENPIAMELPMKIPYTVTDTMDVSKGDTVSGTVLKDAKVDNGMMVKVPAFVKNGDVVNINTESGEYVERVSQ